MARKGYHIISRMYPCSTSHVFINGNKNDGDDGDGDVGDDDDDKDDEIYTDDYEDIHVCSL